MSDINLLVLCGCLSSDAEFTQREGFVSVKMKLITSHMLPKRDAPPEPRKVFHNIQTTLDDKPSLIDAWKLRCIKGARLTIKGILDLDVVEGHDGSTRHLLFVRARSGEIVLPDAVVERPKPEQKTADRKPASREIPAKLANCEDKLRF